MSQTHLSDDLQKWPDDPFAVLGLEANAETAEIRRAYARLLHVYKPDQFPEHFQRIRQAYESVMAYAAYRESPEGDLGRTTPVAEQPPAGPEAADRSLAPELDLQEIKGEIDRIWRDSPQRADELYRRCREMASRFPAADETYARLYWLRILAPQLDPDRQAADWLAEGLRAVGTQGGLLHLYFLEAARRPQELLTQRCGNLLLNAPVVPVELAAERWRVAGLNEQWAIVDSDLESLRKRVQNEEPNRWATLLLAAVDALAWKDCLSEGPPAARYFQEVEHYARELAAFNEALTRCDYLFELVSHWRLVDYLVAVPETFRHPLRQVIRKHWDRPPWHYRWDLLNCLEPVADGEDLEQSFQWLDQLADSAAAVFHGLRGLVAGLYNERFGQEEPRDPVELESPAEQLLRRFVVQGYQRFRSQLLQFCLRHRLGREQLIDLVSRGPFAQPVAGQLVGQLAADATLHCLIQTHRLFWDDGGKE